MQVRVSTTGFSDELVQCSYPSGTVTSDFTLTNGIESNPIKPSNQSRFISFHLIIFCLFRPRVEDFEISVRPRGQLQIMARIGSGNVGNERVGDIVLGSSFIRKMELPEILQSRRFLDRLPGRRSSALRSAVT